MQYNDISFFINQLYNTCSSRNHNFPVVVPLRPSYSFPTPRSQPHVSWQKSIAISVYSCFFRQVPTDTFSSKIKLSRVITSKLGLTQVFSRISESTTGYTFTPCAESFTSPGIDTRQKGPPAFSVSSKRHRQMWGEEIA